MIPNISLASYSFHGLQGQGKLDVFGYLDLLYYRYRVEYADIWTGFTPTTDESFMKKIREAMDERGISLANLCIDGPHLWEDDEGKRRAHKEKMLEYLKAAEILGAKTIRIDFGGDMSPMPDEAFEYIVKTFREYCKICGEFGAKIGPENHWGWDKSSANLIKVAEAVDMKNYGHLFHFNGFIGDDLIPGTEYALKYAMHTHVPASTMPDAREIMRRLAVNGYEGTYSVEHHSGENELIRVDWQLGCVREFRYELLRDGIDEPKPDYMSGELRKVFTK